MREAGAQGRRRFLRRGREALGGDRLVLTKEGVHEGLGIEILQVFGGLPHADQPNGHMKGVGDSDHHTAASRPIQFRQSDAGDADCLMKLRRLRDGILPNGCVQHEEHFVRRARRLSRNDAFHLTQFIHQIRFGMESPGRIDEHHIRLARFRCRQPVENHGGRVRPGALVHNIHPQPFSPHLQLLDRGRAKRISGDQERVTAGLF